MCWNCILQFSNLFHLIIFHPPDPRNKIKMRILTTAIRVGIKSNNIWCKKRCSHRSHIKNKISTTTLQLIKTCFSRLIWCMCSMFKPPIVFFNAKSNYMTRRRTDSWTNNRKSLFFFFLFWLIERNS